MKRNSFLIVSKELAANNRLSVTAKLLFAQLLDYRNDRSGQCNPWEATVAQRLGISRATVIRGVAALEKAGLLKIIRGQRGNRYEFPMLQNATSHVANCNSAESQNATWETPTPLYEPYLEKEERPRAEARVRVFPPPHQLPNAAPNRPSAPRKDVGVEFDPLRGKFLSTAQWQQVGWALADEVYDELVRKAEERDRKRKGA